MHVGSIKAGSRYEIELRVPSTTRDSVALAIFYTALEGTPGTDPIVEVIVPGGSKKVAGLIPSGALRLVIDADLSDNGGTFDLRLTEVGGVTWTKSGLKADTRWSAVIVAGGNV